ncbi:L,D-transpeptidase [Sphaerotilus mobilis]|uniref:L,D-transpeptidase-like protein n=1 Tax=Sphaerotilus mobilis TaxID=47994 RepID=A0A4Q7LUT1_9BURK|nr:L,D-transpeptidase [Sphaerotilus mobilis]RZS58331.1 L,D-transpeptidase-like protein [Sphaerotilus mobilis]
MGALLALVLGLLIGLANGARAQASADLQVNDPLAIELDVALGLARSGQRDAARLQLEALARRWPDRPEPHMNLATLAIQDQDGPAARSHLEAALRTSPMHARSYELLQLLHGQMARHAYDQALGQTRGDSLPLTLPWTLPKAASRPLTPARADNPALAASPAASAEPPPRTAAPDVTVDTPPFASMTSTEAPAALPRLAWVALLSLALLAGGMSLAWARTRPVDKPIASAVPADDIDLATAYATTIQPDDDAVSAPRGAAPEARLIAVYRLIGQARLPQALAAVESLVRDVPQFALAQLVYGDLLLASTGDLTPSTTNANPPQGQALRREAVLRLQALREAPPAGTWPRQVLQLSASVRHVVAVDTTRARLYVIENQAGSPRIVGDHYVSIGSRGTGKRSEGDQRTPLGVYSITSHLAGAQLGDFYGAGALPLNYPNDLDRQLGRTGANIWIHGTPTGQYARAPLATNGCIVMANDDLARWLRLLAPRHTPVIVAERLDWVAPRALMAPRQTALGLIETWRRARMQPDLDGLMALYSMHFDNGEDGYDAWRERLRVEAKAGAGRERELDELSVLSWNDPRELLVVTFRERLRGSTHGLMRRQYWSHDSGQWRIFSEGVLE